MRNLKSYRALLVLVMVPGFLVIAGSHLAAKGPTKLHFAPQSLSGTGLTAEYGQWINSATDPTFDHRTTRTDPSIDFTWNSSNPLPAGVNYKKGRIIWSGYIKFNFSETYNLTVPNNKFKLKLWEPGGSPISLSSVVQPGPPNQQPVVYTTPAIVAASNYRISVTVNSDTADYPFVAYIKWQSASQAAQIVPSAQFAPAVTASALPEYRATLRLPKSVVSEWTLPIGATGVSLFRGVNTVTSFASTISGANPVTGDSYTDSTGAEGVAYEYAGKACYSNPVTGAVTLSDPVRDDIQTGSTLNVQPVNTGSGKVGLFWTSGVEQDGFHVYRSSAIGSLGTKLTASPVRPVAPRGGPYTFMYTVAGLTPGTTSYYTVKQVNSSGSVLHTSEQVAWTANTDGLPWGDPDPSAAINMLREDLQRLHPNLDFNEFTTIGPDGVTYQRSEQGNVSVVDTTGTFDEQSGVYQIGGQEAIVQPYQAQAGRRWWERPEGLGLFRRVETTPGGNPHPSFGGVFLTPGTNSLRKGSSICIYSGGRINGLRGEVDMGIAHLWDSQLPQPNNFYRHFYNTGRHFILGDRTLPKWGQALNRRIALGSHTMYLSFMAMGSVTPRSDGFIESFVYGVNDTPLTDDAGRSVGFSSLVAYHPLWTETNIPNMVVKRTNSIAQARPTKPSEWPVRPRYYRQQPDYAFYASWGIPTETGSVRVGNEDWIVDVGTEETNDPGRGPLSIAALYYSVNEPWFNEDVILLDARH